MSVRSVKIALDEDKILREGEYKLDEIAKKAKLTTKAFKAVFKNYII